MNARKILAFAIGPIGNAALGLLTLPVITWLFSADDVGRISMLNVAVSFCVLFSVWGLIRLTFGNTTVNPIAGSC